MSQFVAEQFKQIQFEWSIFNTIIAPVFVRYPMVLFRKIITGLLILLLLLSTPLKAKEAMDKAHPLKIAIISDNSPYSMSLPDGSPTGLYVEFWKLWAKTNQVTIQFVLADYSKNIISLKHHQTDFHAGLFIDKQRQKWADFSIPIHRVKSGFFFNGDISPLPPISALNGKIVGVSRGTFQEMYLRENFPQIKLDPFDHVEDAINDLLNKKIQAIFTEVPFLDAQLGKTGLRGVFKLSPDNQISNTVHALVPKGQPELVAFINQGIKNIPVSEIIALEKKWLPGTPPFFSTFISPDINNITLKQFKWLQLHHNLSFGIDEHAEPFEYINKNGDYSGISSDYINIVKDKLKLNLHAHENHHWHDLVNMLKTGKIDMLPAIVKTRERSKHILFTKPYLSFPMVITTRKDKLFIQNIDDLNQHNVGIVKGYFIEELLKREHPEIKLHKINSTSAGLKMVNEGKLDAFIANLAVVTHILNTSNLDRVRIASSTPYNLDLSIGVRQGLEPLIPILNTALDSINKDTRTVIANRWLALNVNLGTSIGEYLIWSAPILLFLTFIIIYVVRSNRKLQFVINERKKIQKSLEKARNVAEAANQAKDNFLANISHEIRTPMNAVVGMSHLLQQSTLDKEQMNYLNILNHSADTLVALIDDLLDLSKIDSGKMEIESITFSLETLVAEVQSQIQIIIDQKPIALTTRISPRIPRYLKSDPLRLKQILMNLLSNAVKFTDQGEIKLNVDISQTSENELLLHFTISDTGIGMTEKQIKKLFQTYSQADSSTSRKYGGTGLGLSISKKLTEMMGGGIWVKSKLSGGSTFHFTVLCLLCKSSSNELNPEHNAQLSSATHLMKNNLQSLRQKYQQLHHKKILLVDDNEVNLTIACKILHKTGMKITTAQNGQEALNALASQSFDAILMDIQMPVMDGYAATRIIRENPDWQHLPIIAMSANVLVNDVKKALDSGMDAHIAKPLNIDVMLNTINDILASKAQQALQK